MKTRFKLREIERNLRQWDWENRSGGTRMRKTSPYTCDFPVRYPRIHVKYQRSIRIFHTYVIAYQNVRKNIYKTCPVVHESEYFQYSYVYHFEVLKSCMKFRHPPYTKLKADKYNMQSWLHWIIIWFERIKVDSVKCICISVLWIYEQKIYRQNFPIIYRSLILINLFKLKSS